MTTPLLDIDNLVVDFQTNDGVINAVKSISLSVEQGKVLGIVGESGSGKSQAMHAVMGLLASNGVASGSVKLAGKEILNLPHKKLNDIRGSDVAMVFQDPMTSLNPYMTIGAQMMEVLTLHQGLKKKAAFQQCVDMLAKVKIRQPEQRMGLYPHEFSGGMRQRVMIAMAMLCQPTLLIADEPTTALDVTVQAEIIRLLRELSADLNTAILFITHDLGVAAGLCDHIAVMQHGNLVEVGTVDDVFYRPQQAYTKKLLSAVPKISDPAHISVAEDNEILRVENINVHFKLNRREQLHAVKDISFTLNRGETLGIVGESGSGKSTLARAILGMVPATGKAIFKGTDMLTLPKEQLRLAREELQVVFQDPLASLNPRMTAAQIIGEPLRTFHPELSKAEVAKKVAETLAIVGLSTEHINRYPHEFSGGQCQRIGIARALILQPELIICDEAVSALDVTIQAQVITLLIELQKKFDLSLIFIAHDLSVVKQISDRVLVMQLGEMVEQGDVDEVFSTPQAEYTQRLLSAVPIADPAIEKKRLANYTVEVS